MQHHFHLPEFGKHERPCVFLGAWEEIEAIAILFERERIIAKGGFKTRISRRLSFSHSTIKGLKREIDAFEHILQNLRWDLTQVRSDFFAAEQLRTLSFIGKNDACHAIGAFAFIERRVVHLAAQPKPPLKPIHLLVSRIDAELIRFSGLRIFLWLLRHAFVARCNASPQRATLPLLS